MLEVWMSPPMTSISVTFKTFSFNVDIMNVPLHLHLLDEFSSLQFWHHIVRLCTAERDQREQKHICASFS